ncbi:MAG TPA: acyl-CoA dehydrogenase family protein [Solirubrobacteraceae bacterium]|nr:acyl-CoA dehydrogenase family protein [Solirubrobacteraceae bacterium]
MVPGPEGLVERVEALLPLLAENAARTEQLRRVAPESIEALTEAGVFRMTAPRHLGGYEADVATQYDVLRVIGTACPSTSWVTTILTAMIWNLGMFSDEAQEEVLGEPDARVASVFAPGGNARRVDGGVVVSGRWPFNTGCHHAQWAIMAALVDEGDGSPPAIANLLIPYSDLEILDDWFASGMAGTGSNTTVGTDVFVPDHRILPLAAQMTLDLPTERNRDNPYYRVPTVPFLIAQAGAAPVGIAQGAFAAFMERLPGRAITYSDYADQSAAPITHQQVGEAAMLLHSADAHARASIDLVAAHSAGEFPLEARARLRAHTAYATREARRAVDVLFEASGASAIQRGVPIQRFQRDIQALANHAFLTATSAIELYGRIACGLDANTVFV